MAEGLKLANDLWEYLDSRHPTLDDSYAIVVAIISILSEPDGKGQELYGRLQDYCDPPY